MQIIISIFTIIITVTIITNVTTTTTSIPVASNAFPINRFCTENPSGIECDPFVRYKTFKDIQRSLGHEMRYLDYLKMDIEGGEWIVLDNIIRTTSVLNATSQISLEIHFDEIRKEKPLEEKRKDIERYLAVFDGLAKLGFQIMNFEENEMNPQYETVDGVTFALYAEILLLRRVI